MCVIINIEDGKFPKFQTLKEAESLNSHGGSIAWLEKGKLNYEKGIKAKQINAIIEKRLKPNNVKIAIIHFRIASVGNVNKKLCHPFPISKEVKTDLKIEDSKFDLLFHNGTVSNWEKMLIKSIQDNPSKIPKGELSDSRVIAFLLKRHGHDIIKDSKMNKFSILTKKGIVKYGSWVKVGDNECSNDYFVKKTYEPSNWGGMYSLGGYSDDYNNDYYGKTTNSHFNSQGVWINGKKQEVKKQIKTALNTFKGKIRTTTTSDEVNKFLKTKEDYKYYDLCVKDFYVTDDEILDHLCDGLRMIDVYDMFEDIYGHRSQWSNDFNSSIPTWEEPYR